MSGWRARLGSEFRARYGLAAAAGLLLGLAFPKFSVAGLAWIAPGLLLWSGAGASGRTAFRAGFTGGLAYYLLTLYWLLHIPVRILPVAGWIALSGYVALYPAVWVWLCWKLFPAPVGLARHPWAGPVRASILAAGWLRRLLWTLQCAALWVGLEMILARLFSGFPWEFLGVSQYQVLPVIQVASVTGVYGVSFLIVWFSSALLPAALSLAQARGVPRLWAREAALPLLAVVAVVLLGFRAIRNRDHRRPTVRAALIQPSIPQTLIWDERENAHRFQQLLELSEEALARGADILVWPEASVPNMLRHDRATADAIMGLARKYRVWAIVGSDDAEYRAGTNQRVIDYFNSAFAISPEGELAARYVKRQLVIFGEYMPLSDWLPFLKKISPAGESGFTAGKAPAPFYLRNLGVRASVLICFEDTFPHLVREYVQPQTDFLVNLTNNGWFGESAAQWQHAAAAVFRAVENRIPLVRCANNGLTCWVDASGGLHDVYFPGGGNIYQAGFKIVRVPVLRSGETRALTFYTRHGDVFGWGCAGFAALSLLVRRRGAQKSNGIS